MLLNCYSDSEEEDNVVFKRDGEIKDEQANPEYTVEDVVEHIGLGWFQIKILAICGLFGVSVTSVK